LEHPGITENYLKNNFKKYLMQKYSVIMQKVLTLTKNIKANKTSAALRSFFVLVIIVLSFTLSWNKPPSVSVVRNELPVNSTSNGLTKIIIEPDDGITPVLNLINNAEKSIDLVIYQMTDKDISDALINAKERGVHVRVLLNLGYYGKKENTTNDLAYQYLQNGGVEVHWAPKYFALTHQKTLVIDNNKALIMTWNFVPKYYPTGRDFGILDSDINDVTAIEKTFEADWNNKQIDTQLGDDLVWSPSSENDLLLIIENTKETLDIYNEEMNYDVITKAIKSAEARGVQVRIVMTYNSANKQVFNDLIESGAEIHTYSASSKKIYIHAKTIISDSKYAFVGSENFSFNSLNKNRELGIFVKDSSVISPLLNTFNFDFQNGKVFK
jgi:cardiolipin synthase